MPVEVSADVVVVGGGVAGVCAALAAAGAGVRVSLITNRPVPGGNSSSEIRVWTRGASGGGNLFSEEMGILGELKMRNLYTNPECNVILWDEVLLDAILAEDRIQLFLNTHITGAELGGGKKLVLVRGFQMASEKELVFSGSYFIDATGDGSIGAAMGAPFVVGQEGKDSFTMGSSLFFVSKKAARPVPFIPPAYIHRIETIRRFISSGGRLVNEKLNGCDYWWFEIGGDKDTIRDNQEITLELKRVALGVWNYIKNSGEFAADNLALEWIGSMPGKRESRRFTGAYTLQREDLTGGRSFEDAVAYGGWFMDFHPAGGVYAAGEENCVQIPVFTYPIPLGCLHNPDFPNLLFAGRDISVSRDVFASSRIMDTCALTGHAAGAAAAYACLHVCPPSRIGANVRALQELLASQDLALPWQVRDSGDNLARRARVSASSTLEETD
ncbi:MAG: FAD-dependent oxidoreductase, partial [Treponema sp.]|nr:FAD-dependent oxidoreductase [Treponema sp.]